jgi:hypothetical protein
MLPACWRGLAGASTPAVAAPQAAHDSPSPFSGRSGTPAPGCRPILRTRSVAPAPQSEGEREAAARGVGMQPGPAAVSAG